MDAMAGFAPFLRARRLERGHTQTSLAQALGVSPGAVSRWEAGERVPGPGHLAALTRELRLPLGRALELLFPEDAAARAYYRARVRQEVAA